MARKKKNKKSKLHKKSDQAKNVSETTKEEAESKKDEAINGGPLREIKIKIIGVGGGGGSIVSEISAGLKKVKFAAANTDASALNTLGKKKIKKLQFGKDITGGLGTGMDPELGRKAALEAEEEITKMVEGQDINILVSCLGGGTGSGAVPVFAEKSKKAGALTYGIFTLPFEFEGQKKISITKETLKKASPHLDAISILPNENIFKIVDRTTPLKKALSEMNKNLASNLEGLIETIYEAGLINIDFADIKTILEEQVGGRKLAYLSTTIIKKEEEDAKEIVKKAVSNPLYPHGIDRAQGILFNITGGKDLGLAEISAISQEISSFTENGAKVIFGVSETKNFSGRMKISLLATGCGVNYFSEEIISGEQEKEDTAEIESIEINDDKDKSDNFTNTELEDLEKESEKGKEKKDDGEVKVQTTIDDSDKEEAAKTLRRNGVERKKANDEEEKEILEKEEKWETPTFLRKALGKDDKKS